MCFFYIHIVQKLKLQFPLFLKYFQGLEAM